MVFQKMPFYLSDMDLLRAKRAGSYPGIFLSDQTECFKKFFFGLHNKHLLSLRILKNKTPLDESAGVSSDITPVPVFSPKQAIWLIYVLY
jgi:hypothetical protein